MKQLVSAAIWASGAFLTVLLYFVMLFFVLILYPFDKKRKVAHAQCYWWSDILCRLNPQWRIGIAGLENIDRKRAYVIVANHQSLADIVVIYQIKAQFKWVAKESLFKIPFLGWCMSLARHIKLDRGNFSSIKKVYRQAAEWLRKDMSVLFFPEGTRSETGEMKDFQNGAFKLAIKEKKPVLPILIQGTADAIPKHGRQFSENINCSITVLPAVETSDLGPADFERLRDDVRAKLEAAA
jgi:1-acyl-sn-glycerol-3-phosphate acyltransferase